MMVLTAVMMVGLALLFLEAFGHYRRRVADVQATQEINSLDARVRASDALIAEKLTAFRTLVPLVYPEGVPAMVVDDPVADLEWQDLERKKAGLAAQWEIWQSLERKELKAYWEAHGEGLEMPETIWFQLARLLQAAGEFGVIGAETGRSGVGVSEREMRDTLEEMREVVRLRMEAVEMRMEVLRMDGGAEAGPQGGD